MQRTITNLSLTLLSALALAGPGAAQSYPSCSQDHPKRARRLESLAKRGDAYMARSASGHAVLYAVQRYGLEGHFDDAAIQAAAGKMYDLLKWKLGSPALVAAQWLTAGYQHFDKGYVDEAAAILLGVIEVDIGEPELKVPPFMQDWVAAQVGKSGEAIAAFLVSEGVPPALAKILGDKAEQALAALWDRNKVGVYLPKSYDVNNQLVEAAVAALRNDGGGTTPAMDWLRDKWKGPRPNGPGKGPGLEPVDGDVLPDLPDRLPPSVVERIAELEERIARLEALFARMTTPGGTDGGAPAARGYTSARIEISNYTGEEVRVHVNGLLSGIYQAHMNLDLGAFLVPGKMNAIAFDCPDPGKDADFRVAIHAQVPDSETWVKVFDFRSKKDRYADGIELPITGE